MDGLWRCKVRVFQMMPDGINHCIQLIKNFNIHIADNAPTERLEICRSFFISYQFIGFRVTNAINLDYELFFDAGKVRNEWANRNLATEVIAVNLFAAYFLPKNILCSREVTSMCFGPLMCF